MLGDGKRRRKLIALVHVAKAQLCLDDDTYRDLLERVTGQRSASRCTEAQLGEVVDAMRERGFVVARSGPRSEKLHVRKVWGLWAELEITGRLRSPGRGACRAFCKRMTGVEDPEWLTPEQANVIIEALKAWLRRPVTEGAPPEGEP